MSYYKLLSELLECLGNEDGNFMNAPKGHPTHNMCLSSTYIYVLDAVGSFKWLFLSKFILIVQLILLDLSSF
jgi:hypothetical protein